LDRIKKLSFVSGTVTGSALLLFAIDVKYKTVKIFLTHSAAEICEKIISG